MRRRSISLLAVALVVAGLLTTSPARAGAITVTRFDDPPPGACDPGDCSLREAIMAANAAPGANSIQLDPGTYVLSHGPIGDDAALNGDLDIVDTLTLRGSGPARTFIDGGGTLFGDRILHLPSADTLSLVDLTLRNAVTTQSGSGIHLTAGATLLMSDATVVDTVGGPSPGIKLEGATAELTRVVVEGQTSTTGGCCSGISTEAGGRLTLTDVVVRDNHSPTSCCAGVSTANGTDLLLTRVMIDGNTSGACCAGLSTSGGGTVELHDVTVSNNVASGESCCAGIALSGDGMANLHNVTVSGNSSESCCAGLGADGTTTVKNATITGNVADSDGNGGCCAGLLGADQTFVSNTIAAGNRAGATAEDCSGQVTSMGFNLIQAAGGCAITGDTTGNLLGADPRLGPLSDNGGSVPTHALLRGSPALNAGSPARPGSGGSACDSADARGAPRKNCDIGAYELVRCGGTVVNRVGTSGKDTLRGTNRKDGMIGLGGKDTLNGRGGKDALCGGGGKDKLKGGGGKDALIGQGGNDQCIGGPSSDRVKGCEREKSV